MSGWVPAPVDGWPEVAEALSSVGAWPKAAAVIDLRWWVDQRGREIEGRGQAVTPSALVAGVPGRPTLAKRWGWTDHAVRSFLRDTSSWWDSRRWGDAPSPADRQRTASESPADRQPDIGSTETIEAESPAGRQPVASESPAGRHTRGDPQAQAQAPSPEESTRRKAHPWRRAWDRAWTASGQPTAYPWTSGEAEKLRAASVAFDRDVDRMERAAGLFLGAVARGEAWKGHTPTVTRFVRDAPDWSLRAAQPATGPPVYELVTGDDWTPPPRNPAWRTRP